MSARRLAELFLEQTDRPIEGALLPPACLCRTPVSNLHTEPPDQIRTPNPFSYPSSRTPLTSLTKLFYQLSPAPQLTLYIPSRR